MDTHTKTYGYMKDGTPLTDESAQEIVDSAFAMLESGEGKVLKSPAKQIRLKVSVQELPIELQRAAQYK